MMNDTEIIKALECCAGNYYDDFNCDNCPYCKCQKDTEICNLEELARDVLGIINRQKAEIEKLKAAKKLYLDRWGESIKLAREDEANIIKEFAERIKQYFNPDSSNDFREWLDTLVKEMGGEG